MADTDTILQGVLIGGFALIGINIVVYCMRKHRMNIMMKKSPSMEELSSVSTEDPET